MIRQSKIAGQSVISRKAANAGFTLIELTVVIVILSIVAVLVFPRLPSTREGDLRSSARNLAAGLRYLVDKAIATKQYYRLTINIGSGRMEVTRILPDNEEVAVTDVTLSRLSLHDQTGFEDIVSSRLGKQAEGEVVLEFSPLGANEFIVFHLKSEDGSRHYTVALYPGSGRVVVLNGYQDGTLSVDEQEGSR